jgi:hypothetical protein
MNDVKYPYIDFIFNSESNTGELVKVTGFDPEEGESGLDVTEPVKISDLNDVELSQAKDAINKSISDMQSLINRLTKESELWKSIHSKAHMASSKEAWWNSLTEEEQELASNLYIGSSDLPAIESVTLDYSDKTKDIQEIKNTMTKASGYIADIDNKLKSQAEEKQAVAPAPAPMITQTTAGSQYTPPKYQSPYKGVTNAQLKQQRKEIKESLYRLQAVPRPLNSADFNFLKDAIARTKKDLAEIEDELTRRGVKEPFKKPELPNVYTPKDKDKFIEGSDIWEALNAGRTVVFDQKGFIKSITDAEGNEYDIYGNITKQAPEKPVTPTPTAPVTPTPTAPVTPKKQGYFIPTKGGYATTIYTGTGKGEEIKVGGEEPVLEFGPKVTKSKGYQRRYVAKTLLYEPPKPEVPAPTEPPKVPKKYTDEWWYYMGYHKVWSGGYTPEGKGIGTFTWERTPGSIPPKTVTPTPEKESTNYQARYSAEKFGGHAGLPSALGPVGGGKPKY